MLNGHKKLPYTKREILQQEYPPFWGGANELVRILRELQNLLVKSLPMYKKGLPKAFEKIEDKRSQDFILNYIKFKVLYAFADVVWKQTDQHCQEIAINPDNRDSAKKAIIHSFEVFNDNPQIDILSNSEQGYDMMKGLIDKYDPLIDFGVIQKWSYKDIVNNIQNYGFKYEQLWKDVLADPDPTEVSIGELLDDDQPMRFY